jgi:hypothetical protein
MGQAEGDGMALKTAALAPLRRAIAEMSKLVEDCLRQWRGEP